MLYLIIIYFRAIINFKINIIFFKAKGSPLYISFFQWIHLSHDPLIHFKNHQYELCSQIHFQFVCHPKLDDFQFLQHHSFLHLKCYNWYAQKRFTGTLLWTFLSNNNRFWLNCLVSDFYEILAELFVDDFLTFFNDLCFFLYFKFFYFLKTCKTHN